jgi:transcriptional regulator with XRE-family HTH domain
MANKMEKHMAVTELYRTYAENIRMAAAQKGLSIRDLSNRTGFSYEHIRKIWMGRTPKHKDAKLTISRDCNDLLCALCDLPDDAMFELAEREKFAQKNGYAPVELPDPMGQELVELWMTLNEEHKAVILTMGRSFAQVAMAS